MNGHGLARLLACGLLLAVAAPALPQGKVGEDAPDFPPGVFSDSGSHRLSDLRGKIVVLYFFEPG